jgi:hypothetical protein
VRIAYLSNSYPAVSQSFIRREIKALEALGNTVHRFSVRPSGELKDAADREEQERTIVLMDGTRGVLRLTTDTLRCLFTGPLAWLGGLSLALRMAGADPTRWIKHIAYFTQACSLKITFRSAPPDHLHAHFGTNPATVARL